MNINNENWKTIDINVDSLWLFEERDKTGKHENIYHGNFIPQIPRQLIKIFTNPKDYVLELFMGAGTTLYECEALDRNYIGFDINENIINHVKENMKESNIDYYIGNCDVQNSTLLEKELNTILNNKAKFIDLLIAHPPYLDIIKFTNLEYDLSNIKDVDKFIDALVLSISNGVRYLKKGGYLALVMGDIYRNKEVIPLAFMAMNAVKNNLSLKLKGIIVKNIEGNRGKLGTYNIWKYRAMRSDYYLFKHEYIFVLKKDF